MSKYSFIKSLCETPLSDAGGSMHKTLMDILGIDEVAAKRIIKQIALGDQLAFVELIDDDDVTKDDVEDFLKSLRIKLSSINNKNSQVGEQTMTKKDRIEEGVMGMTAVPGMSPDRLRQLAGIRYETAIEEKKKVDEDFGMGDDFDAGVDAMATDPVEPVEGDEELGVDPVDVIDPVDPMGDEGMPGEVGADPIEPVVDMEATSVDAYGEIQDALNNINTKLTDIKISEYKPLLSQLEALVSDLRNRGNDALREHREAMSKKNRVGVKKKT